MPSELRLDWKRGSTAQITVAVVLIIVVAIAGGILFTQMGSKKKSVQIQELLEQSADPTISLIPVQKDELDALLEEATSFSSEGNKEAIYRTLGIASATDGTDIEKRIAEVATQEKLTEEIRVRLFQILEKRKGTSALPLLAKYFLSAEDTRAVVASIKAAQPNLTDKEVIELFKLISFTSSADVRVAAERAVKEFAELNKGTTRIGSELAKAYRAAQDPAAQQAYLRLLGATGGNSSREVLQAALKSNENSIRISAYKSLQDWPDDSMFEFLFEGLTQESNPEMQGYAFDSAIRFLTKAEATEEKKLVSRWKKMVDQTRDDSQKTEIINSIGESKSRWAIPILQFYLEDENDDITFLSEQALEKIEENS